MAIRTIRTRRPRTTQSMAPPWGERAPVSYYGRGRTGLRPATHAEDHAVRPGGERIPEARGDGTHPRGPHGHAGDRPGTAVVPADAADAARSVQGAAPVRAGHVRGLADTGGIRAGPFDRRGHGPRLLPPPGPGSRDGSSPCAGPASPPPPPPGCRAACL